MRRLAGEPDLSFLAACLYADDPARGLERAGALYALAAPGAQPAALDGLLRKDAADWDWEGRARRSLEDGLLDLLELARGSAHKLLAQVEPIDVREAVQLGRLASQLTHAYERVRAARPKSLDAGADYSVLSDADLEALRGILDRAARAG